MFGFTSQFVPVDATQPEIKQAWTSMTQFSKVLRKIGKGLRSVEQFDDAMNRLANILSTIHKTNGLSNCIWITENDMKTIRDLLFVDIQTIGHIFLQNEHQNATKSLKTDIENYKSFFGNLSTLISDNKHNSFTLFSNKQIKKIHALTTSVMDYNSECQLSIVEKQNSYLKQKHIETQMDEEDLLQKLQSKLSKTRIERCEMVLKHRTDRIILVLDRCYDVRNQCAMLRTAELFGIQNVWIVKPINYKNCVVYDSISRHSQLWLSLRYFDSCLECIAALKHKQQKEEKEINIWVMDIGKDALELCTKTIDEYRSGARVFPQYLAIVMGKEAEGPSKEFVEACDQRIYLPQFGFCESFNVSVACALGLQSIFAMSEDKIRGKMDEKERNKLRYLWYYQLTNDKKMKKEMDQFTNKTIKLRNGNGNGNSTHMHFDFRRNEFKHWDSKKLSFKLRKKLEEQQNHNFLNASVSHKSIDYSLTDKY